MFDAGRGVRNRGPVIERGVVIGGGQVMARFKWLDGTPGCMTKYAAKKPMQDYKAKDFKEQFKLLKREPPGKWDHALIVTFEVETTGRVV